MKSLFLKIFILGIVLQFVSISIFAISPSKTRLLIIFDCSGSMQAKWGAKTRMVVAKEILSKMMDSLATVPDLELALRCYGHQFTVPQHNCEDSKLEIPFGKNNALKIKTFVQKLEPKGYTPIAYSLTQAAGDFPDTRKKNVILLITDGIEECNGDPCAASKALSSKQVSLKPYVVGIGLSLEKMKSFECVGKYYTPKNDKELGTVISGVISNALENTTLQIELINEKGDKDVSHVGVILSDVLTDKSLYHFIHTLDKTGKPDTIIVDPNYVYDITVNTVPEIKKLKVNLQTAHHNVIQMNASQCEISFNLIGGEADNNPYYYIKKAGTGDIIYHGETKNKMKILFGLYDFEILTLPRIHIYNKNLNSATSIIENIPKSGFVTFSFSNQTLGTLFVVKNGADPEYVADIEGNPLNKLTYKLLPGDYLLVERKKSSKEMKDAQKINFHIDSGSSKELRIE